MSRFVEIGFWGLFVLVGCAIDKPAIEDRIAADQQKRAVTVKPFSQTLQPIANARITKSNRPYTLGVEDAIEIFVLNDSTLDSKQSVRPDGKISFFPTGDMQAAGLTLEQLRKDIVKRLKNVAS